jgi:hypothetical protein
MRGSGEESTPSQAFVSSSASGVPVQIGVISGDHRDVSRQPRFRQTVIGENSRDLRIRSRPHCLRVTHARSTPADIDTTPHRLRCWIEHEPILSIRMDAGEEIRQRVRIASATAGPLTPTPSAAAYVHPYSHTPPSRRR